MAAKPKPSQAAKAYKEIIDQLVGETRKGGGGFQVKDKGIYSRGHPDFNAFIASLPAKQRKLLGEMLQEERDGAIHDVLAVLSWWVDCRELGFVLEGEAMPVDISGMGLHGDFIGRRDGWKWPKSR